nr:hypothetical protein [Afipia felis]
MDEDGEVKYLLEPEYHGNPISNDGSLVTVDYGYEIYRKISEWADFDVRITRLCDKTHGILGEYTEVIVCKKRSYVRPSAKAETDSGSVSLFQKMRALMGRI